MKRLALASIALLFFVPSVSFAAGLANNQVQAILSLLSSFGASGSIIASVDAALGGAPVSTGSLSTSASTGSSSSTACTFTRDLMLGTSGNDVTCLQNALVQQGYAIPAGATGYYGAETQAAVAEWQRANHVVPSGNFDSASRANWDISASVPVVEASNNPGTGGQTAQQPQSKSPLYFAGGLASDFAPRLAVINCGWYNRYGALWVSKTSNGLLGPMASNGDYFVNTVLGGVMDSSMSLTNTPSAPESCTISFPAGASLYGGGYSTVTVGLTPSGNSPVDITKMSIDYAQIPINSANVYLSNYAQTENYCKTRPAVGGPIAIFGYPTGGALETLTGAITGTSGYYDTTSVSVPAGMLGSTAVSLSSGCVIGQINASGQIVDVTQLSYLMGW